MPHMQTTCNPQLDSVWTMCLAESKTRRGIIPLPAHTIMNNLPAIHTIGSGDQHFPPALARCLGDGAPAALRGLGALDLLARPKLAIFCSARAPGSVILQTYDLAQRLRQDRYTVIGGFHSPVEQECLTVLLRGPAPVIVCPARDIEDMRLPVAWRQPLAEGRLLILSPFSGGQRRPTAEMAQARNRFVAALADVIVIAHAERGGKTEALTNEIMAWGKPIHSVAEVTRHVDNRPPAL